MKKFILGAVTGSVLTLLGLVGYAAYQTSEYAQVKRCMGLYLPAVRDMENDPSMQEMMKREGFKTIDEAVKNRCEYWVRNGQKF